MEHFTAMVTSWGKEEGPAATLTAFVVQHFFVVSHSGTPGKKKAQLLGRESDPEEEDRGRVSKADTEANRPEPQWSRKVQSQPHGRLQAIGGGVRQMS